MRITRIAVQERNPSRRNLYVDDAFALGIGTETLLRFGLRAGDEISHETLREIEKTEELVNARGAALRYLGVRPRTEQEIRDKLRDKEFGDEEIAQTISGLKTAGLINDPEFARMYVRDAMLKHPAGALMLRRKLILLGVDRATVDQAITEILSTVNLEETARALACDFIRKTRNLKPGETPRRLRTRISAYLGRRGFSWDLIQSTLKAVLPGSSGPDEQEDSEAPGV